MNYSRYYRTGSSLKRPATGGHVNTFEDLHSLKMASLDELLARWHQQRQGGELKAAMELGVLVMPQMKLRRRPVLQDGRPVVVQELKDAYRDISFAPSGWACEKRDHQEENDFHRWAE